MIDAEEAAWTKDAVAVYSFIVILAALDHDSAPDAIRRMMNKAPWFKLSLAAHARSLCRYTVDAGNEDTIASNASCVLLLLVVVVVAQCVECAT